MKNICDGIKSNGRQIIQLLSLIFAAILPHVFNFRDLFSKYLLNNPLSAETIIMDIFVNYGEWITSLVLILFVMGLICKINYDFVMNRRSVYHNYSYAWYWFCAKILRIRKCSLILVPIFMQFKLVIRATFDELQVDEEKYPVDESVTDCSVRRFNLDGPIDEINLILEDTYAINLDQIPGNKRSLMTIKVSRNERDNFSRHFSENFIESSNNVVRNLQYIHRLNVYATTNPMNTKHIASRVFAMGNRGNVRHLFVFQQKKDGRRSFENYGHKIY